MATHVRTGLGATRLRKRFVEIRAAHGGLQNLMKSCAAGLNVAAIKQSLAVRYFLSAAVLRRHVGNPADAS